MDELKLLEYRQQNRQIGWRATTDIIARHILDNTSGPLNFGLASRQIKNDSPKSNRLQELLDQIKNNSPEVHAAKEYVRRLNEGLLVLMYSFDDEPDTIIVAVRHLMLHYRIMGKEDWDRSEQLFAKEPGFQLFFDRYGQRVMEICPSLDSRFH